MHITDSLVSFRESYLGLRLREQVWRRRFPRKYPPLAQAFARHRFCSNRKPRRQINREIALCRKFWKCYPFHYFLYDLYRADQCLTDAQLLNYVPEFFFYEVFLPHHNRRELNALCGDKGVIEEMFRAAGIPQPRTLAKMIDGQLYSAKLQVLTWEQLTLDLESLAPARTVLKPARGRGGRDVHIFHRGSGNAYATRGGQPLTSAYLATAGAREDFVLQVGLEQHPQLKELYPNSINTLRVTSENIRGKVRLMSAELRLGRDGKEVDNASQSGIEVRVDLNDGQLETFGLTNHGERFDRHPETGTVFAAFIVPDWDAVKAAVQTFAQHFPRVPYLGWDIAITTEGIVAIEVNWGFGIDGQNLFEGLRDKLRIEDPDYYWHHRGLR